jgi:hypothetical protein
MEVSHTEITTDWYRETRNPEVIGWVRLADHRTIGAETQTLRRFLRVVAHMFAISDCRPDDPPSTNLVMARARLLRIEAPSVVTSIGKPLGCCSGCLRLSRYSRHGGGDADQDSARSHRLTVRLSRRSGRRFPSRTYTGVSTPATLERVRSV